MGIIISPSNSLAYGVYDIESLDDIYRGYYSGMLDNSQYSLLLENYDVGELSQNDFVAAGIFEPAEASIIEDSAFAVDIWQRFILDDIGRFGIRRYSYSSGKTFGNYYVNYRQGNLAIITDIKSFQNKYAFNKRSISYSFDDLNLTVGNYLVNEGYGLTIGRFDYRPSAGYADNGQFEFWQPVNSFYNGLKIQLTGNKFDGRCYYSDKKYGDAGKRFLGSGIDYISDRFSLGAAFGLNRFKRDNYFDQKHAAGINWKIDLEQIEIGGEIARIGNSSGLYLTGIKYLSASNIKFELWNYAEHFDNYNCSGPAASNYHTFYPDNQDIGFLSTQAGETGVASTFFARRYALGWQVWHQAREDNLKLLAVARWAIAIYDKATVLSQIHYSNKDENERLWLKSGISKTGLPLLNWLGVKLAFDESRLINELSYGFIELRYSTLRRLHFSMSLRSYFDGSSSWLFSEKAFLPADLKLDLDLIINDGLRINLGFEKSL